MKISIIHPSRSRSAIANKVRAEWLDKADGNIEYLFSLDFDDMQATQYDGKCIFNKNRSAIDAINRGAEHVEGDLFVVVSDDFSCPDHWDSLLIWALQGKSDYCVKTKDGLQPTLMTLPIMDRVYYERFGYVYYPEYYHLFCDQEMTVVAHYLGRVVNVDLLFPHNHHTTGKFKKDAISIKNDRSWSQGENLFDKRKLHNFGIEDPICTYESIKWR